MNEDDNKDRYTYSDHGLYDETGSLLEERIKPRGKGPLEKVTVEAKYDITNPEMVEKLILDGEAEVTFVLKKLPNGQFTLVPKQEQVRMIDMSFRTTHKEEIVYWFCVNCFGYHGTELQMKFYCPLSPSRQTRPYCPLCDKYGHEGADCSP